MAVAVAESVVQLTEHWHSGSRSANVVELLMPSRDFHGVELEDPDSCLVAVGWSWVGSGLGSRRGVKEWTGQNRKGGAGEVNPPTWLLDS
jgi:hypothetical protein